MRTKNAQRRLQQILSIPTPYDLTFMGVTIRIMKMYTQQVNYLS